MRKVSRMPSYFHCVLVLLVLATFADQTDAVISHCYVCGGNSSVSAKCADGPNGHPIDLQEDNKKECAEDDVGGCIKTKYVDDQFKQIVTRGCAPEVGMRHKENDCKSTEVAMHAVYFCHCTGDFCNSSQRLLINTVHLLTAVVMSVLRQHL